MAIVSTQLTIEPRFQNKEMVLTGTVAVGESVAIRVLNVVADNSVPAGLKLRLISQCGRMEYAKFPITGDTGWTRDETDATGVLDLNTQVLRQRFSKMCMGDTLDALVLLEDSETNNLYAVGVLTIRNWIQNPLDPTIGATQIQQQIDNLADRLENHQHRPDVDGEHTISHSDLTDRNVAGAHPSLEQGIANNALGLIDLENTLSSVGMNLTTLGSRFDQLRDAVNPNTSIANINANDDLVSMSSIYTAIRTIVDFINTMKGGF